MPCIIHDELDSPGCTRALSATTGRDAMASAPDAKLVSHSRSQSFPEKTQLTCLKTDPAMHASLHFGAASQDNRAIGTRCESDRNPEGMTRRDTSASNKNRHRSELQENECLAQNRRRRYQR
eukprot:2889489-Pleurochrysis_carterae.AAC.8